MPESTHDLLLALAGRVDDDLLAWARELAAIGEDGQAVDLLTATAIADRVVLPAAARAALVEAGRLSRAGLDAERALPAAGADGCEHRFTGDAPDAAAADRLTAGLPGERLRGCRVLLAWRLTPAGAAPGPLPQPVVLVENDGAAGPREVLAYQVAAALERAGTRAAVEVFDAGATLPAYHAAALDVARPLALGRAPEGGPGPALAPRDGAGRTAGDETAPRRAVAERAGAGAPVPTSAAVTGTPPSGTLAGAHQPPDPAPDTPDHSGEHHPPAGTPAPPAHSGAHHPPADTPVSPAHAGAHRPPARPAGVTDDPTPATDPGQRQADHADAAPSAHTGAHRPPADGAAPAERSGPPAPAAGAGTSDRAVRSSHREHAAHAAPEPRAERTDRAGGTPLPDRSGRPESGDRAGRTARPPVDPPTAPGGRPVTRPRPSSGRPGADGPDPLSGPLREPLLEPLLDPTIRPEDPLGLGTAPLAPAADDDWFSGSWALPATRPTGEPAPADAPDERPSRRRRGAEQADRAAPAPAVDTPAPGTPAPGSTPPGTAGADGAGPDSPPGRPAGPSPRPTRRNRYRPDDEPAPTDRPAPPPDPRTRPETLAALSDTERELLAQLQAELAARERRPRVSRRAGIAGSPSSNGNGHPGGNTPPRPRPDTER